jgi:hypothetical protein
MADTLKLKSQEIALSITPNTVFDAKLVRVLNTGASSTLVIVRDSYNNITGSLTLTAIDKEGSHVLIKKDTTDTLESNTGNTVVATSVGFF